MKVCIGGTFNILHKGHKLLINKAFQKAGENGSVFIGLTTGEIIKEKIDARSYEERKRNLEQYLYEKGYHNRSILKPIIDKFGPTIIEEFDAIVVSPETVITGEEINKIRRKNGKKTLEIVRISYVLADDGLPISSSRIKKGEIDSNGRVLRLD